MLYKPYTRSVPKVDLPLLSLDVLNCRRGLVESSTVPGLIASSLSRLACGDMPLTFTLSFVPPDPDAGAGTVEEGATPLAFVLMRLDIAVMAAISLVSRLFLRFFVLASTEGMSSSLGSRLRLGMRDADVDTPLGATFVGGADAGRSKGSAIEALGPGGGGELPIVTASCE